MRILVLGSAAGGGFPQWNCNCANCAALRRGGLRATPRTQSSLAVSANGRDWILVNASPDVRAQLASHPALWPVDGARDTPIRGIVLIDAQIDHTTGLLTLREGTPLQVYCTDAVRKSLSGPHPLFDVLTPFCGVRCYVIPTNGAAFKVAGVEGLSLTAIPLTSSPPRYAATTSTTDPHTIALLITEVASGKALLYAPALGIVEGLVEDSLTRAHCALVDGTFWSDDELIVQGCGTKRARDMGHLSLDGPEGLIRHLRRFPAPRKVLVHINNTNPILNEESPERAILRAENIEVAHDGMHLVI